MAMEKPGLRLVPPPPLLVPPPPLLLVLLLLLLPLVLLLGLLLLLLVILLLLLVLVCLCVCLLEAVDLSSTQRCPVTRVLPPPRQTTLRPAVTPQLSLISDHQPTLKPSTPIIADQLPVVKPAALNPAPPLVVNESLLSTVPYSASSAATQLTLAPDVQLDLRANSSIASREGQKTGCQTLVEKLSAEQTPSLMGQIALPAVIVHSSAGHANTDGQLTSQPDDLSVKRTSTKDRLTAETHMKQTLVADDLTIEKNRQQTSQLPGNLSIEIRYKPTFVGDSLSSKQMVLSDSIAVRSKNELMPNAVEKMRDMRSEQAFMADGLPARRSSLPSDVTMDLKRYETETAVKLAVTPGECVAKPAVTSGECLVNAADKITVATSTAASGTATSECT